MGVNEVEAIVVLSSESRFAERTHQPRRERSAQGTLVSRARLEAGGHASRTLTVAGLWSYTVYTKETQWLG